MSYRPSSPLSSIRPFYQKQPFSADSSVFISEEKLWPTIFPRMVDRIATAFRWAMDLLDLGLM